MKKRIFTISASRRLPFCLAARLHGRRNRRPAPHKKPKTPSEAVLESWNDIGGRIVTMAEDWSEDKYNYRPNAQVRTFADVLRHIAGSNYGLLNHVTGKKIGDEAERSFAGYL